jgi:polysaccharide transporter, PST family
VLKFHLADPHRRLLRNTISLYWLQGLNYAIPVAVLPFLIRRLGIEQYGLLAFAQAFAQYFVVLTDYGFNFSATRAIAQNQNDARANGEVFCAVMFIKTVLCMFGFGILLGFVFFVPTLRHNTNVMLLAYMTVVGSVLFPTWYFQGVQEMRFISLISGFAQLGSALFLFAFIHGPNDTLLALGIQSAGFLAAGLTGLVICLHKYQIVLRWPSMPIVKRNLLSGWHLFISTAAISMYTNTSVVLVALFSGTVQAGYFSAAEKFIRALNGLITPIGQAIFPYVNTIASQSRDAVLRFLSRTLRWTFCLSGTASLILLAAARPIAMLAFGHEGEGSVPILRWIIFIPMLVAVSNILGIQTMLTFGLDKEFSRILLIAGFANIAIGIPLITARGAAGAGMALLFTEIFVTASMLWVLKAKGISILTTGGAVA